MKTRNNFISNSSSSSFIVMKKGYKLDNQYCSSEQEKILIEAGWEGFKRIDALELELGVQPIESDDPEVYGYSVICNEDDVIYFLLKHRIPFTGACHYGDYSVYYPGGKYFYRANNIGKQLETLLYYNIEKEPKEEIEKISITEWMESNSEWWMDVNEL